MDRKTEQYRRYSDYVALKTDGTFWDNVKTTHFRAMQKKIFSLILIVNTHMHKYSQRTVRT